MRIALVVHDIGKQRGHDRYAAELATALAERHDVHVFAGTCRDIDRTRITFHRVPAIRRPDIAKMITFFIGATWILRKFDFDIIHTQGTCCLIQNVATAHFCQASWQEVYQTLDHGDVSRLRQWYHLSVMLLMNRLERFLFARSRCVIALSDQVKHDLVRCYDIKPDHVETIYNGVNVDEFHPDNIRVFRDSVRAELNIASDTFVLVFVGEFKRKGLRHAIEALSHLADNDSVLLVVVQGEDPQLFEALADRLGVLKNVRFVGHRTNVNRFYAMGDAVVFPTLYEPFGFTITEAMSSGIPVITSADAGAAELIRDGEDALLLQDPRNAVDIAGKIQQLIDDKDLRIRLRENARACVEKLSWHQFSTDVETIYERVRQV
ncbi:MAG: glycosyltransferase family 4 protein [Gemmatimonadota bacterium]|nr:glycosyltransferase family 4 protein [Gemmatimonadota bacterium]